MPDPVTAIHAPAIPRPLVVTLATTSMLLAVPALLLYSVPGLVYTERTFEVYRVAYAGTSAESDAGLLSATPFYFLGGGLLLLAVILAALAFPVFRGRNPARLAVWALGLLAVCTSVPQLVQLPEPPPRPPGAPSQSELEQMLNQAVPAWVDPTSLASALVMVLALLVAMVLLGLPGANDYFRKPPSIVPPPAPLHPR
jgi:hypothetical protein